MKFNNEKFTNWVKQQVGDDSYRDAGKDIGISAATLFRIANGIVTPDLKTYAKVCTWLNVKADFFFDTLKQRRA